MVYGRLAKLPGLLLLLLVYCAAPTQQVEVLNIPTITAFPPLKPVDTEYPGNIPDDLPTQLEPAPPVLTEGPNTPCSTSVADVLKANGRTLLATYLAAAPQGQQILSGAMHATILAPSDAALSYLLSSKDNGLAGSQAASTVALYHVLQRTLLLNRFSRRSGLWWNTTLTKAACPTAAQTVRVFSGGQETYARSATNTARFTVGDLAACNSVVHLLDNALQPCCVSLFEELPKFSIVKIQPNVFDGYRAPEPIGNTDAFNRRVFEEAIVDRVLFSSSINTTRTLLWPAPSAWDDFNLGALLPGTSLDNSTRIQAMQLLALYCISYTQIVLPKDIPGADGSAPAITFSFPSALRNMTSQAAWPCSDTLAVSAPAWVSPIRPSLSQLAGQELPGAPAIDSAGGASQPGREMKSAAGDQPSKFATRRLHGGQLQAEVSLPSLEPLPLLLLQQQWQASSAQEQIASAEEQHQGLRKLQAAAAGDSKTVNVVNTYETCEGVRVLVVDAVPVPCDFAALLQNFNSIEQVVDETYARKEQPGSLAEALYDWLLQNGVIKQGQAMSQVQEQQQRQPSSARGLALGVLHWQLQVWAVVLLTAWLLVL